MNNPERLGQLKYLIDLFLLSSFGFISWAVLEDYVSGGDPWKQGDWLINNLAGDVRRGSFGSIIISASDSLRVSPLSLVITIQFSCLVFLFVAFRQFIFGIQERKLIPLLVVSSAIFTVYWMATPQASMRKEILAFTGLTLSALGAVRGGRLVFLLGTMVLSLSIIAHEAMVLFLPTFLAIMLVTDFHRKNATFSCFCFTVVVCVSILILQKSLFNVTFVDPWLVCEPLMQRGLDASICGGAIQWINHDVAYGYQAVLSKIDLENFTEFLISYGISIAPFIYIFGLCREKMKIWLFVLMLAIPFSPLYPVAVDWGRWMSFHVFAVTVVFSCALRVNRVSLLKSPENRHVAWLVALAVLASPNATIGLRGALPKVVEKGLSAFGWIS